MAEDKSTSAPALPPEIWRQVFLQSTTLEDLVHLWTNTRNVCHHFRELVEAIFKINWLEQTSLAFDLGHSFPQPEHKRDQMPGASFTFDRLDEDKGKAIYILDRCDDERYVAIKKSLSHVFEYPRQLLRPQQQIFLLGEIIDAQLPQASFNLDKRELSFDWRGMYSGFFSEIAAVDRENTRRRRELEESNKDESDQGQETGGSQKEKPEGISSEESDKIKVESYKAVRRQRIRSRLAASGESDLYEDFTKYWEKHRFARLCSMREDVRRVLGKSHRADVELECLGNMSDSE